ncbi:MAG: hypothetical protein ACO1NQ_11670 [Flavobacteriales bacterium]
MDAENPIRSTGWGRTLFFRGSTTQPHSLVDPLVDGDLYGSGTIPDEPDAETLELVVDTPQFSGKAGSCSDEVADPFRFHRFVVLRLVVEQVPNGGRLSSCGFIHSEASHRNGTRVGDLQRMALEEHMTQVDLDHMVC